MAKENDGQTLRDYGKRKKQYRKRKVVIFISILLILVIAGMIYLYQLYNRTYHNYKIVDSTPNTKENIVGYLKYEESVVRYSKDGAVAIDQKGNPKWNGSYEMQNPIADVCGEYVVVADRGGNSVHIFNDKGEAGNFNTEYKITKAEVASQGVVAILMLEGDVSYIKLFDKEGEMLTENITNVNKDGYPMDISLSDDGTKLATTFVSVNKGNLETTIAFFNFSKVGQNYTDNFAGGFTYKDIVIPRITFLNNDMVCAYKENGLILYSMKELSDFIVEETTELKIKSVLHSSKYTGLVLEGDNKEASHLILYNLEGDKILDRKLNFDYTNITIIGDEIILYNDLSCLILKTNGKEKFKYTFTSNISAFYPINQFDRYLLVNTEDIAEIQLTE